MEIDTLEELRDAKLTLMTGHSSADIMRNTVNDEIVQSLVSKVVIMTPLKSCIR